MVPIPTGGARPAGSNGRHRGLTLTGRTLPPSLYAGFDDILRNPEKKLSMGVISAVSEQSRMFLARQFLAGRVGLRRSTAAPGP